MPDEQLIVPGVTSPEVPAGGHTPVTPTPSIDPVVAPSVEPVTAPIVEPVTVQPSPEPAPEPVPEPVTEPVAEPVAYEPIGNTALDAAAKVVAEAGFDPVVISNELFEQGKLSDTTLTNLENKLGKEQVALLASAYSAELTKLQAASDARNQSVYDQVGGKETWDAIALWTTTPEAQLSKEAAAEYNSMLAKGGVQAQLAATALKEAYMASPGFGAAQPTQMVQGDQPAPPANAVEPISRRQYVDEKRKAINSGNAAAVAALEARANFTMKHAAAQWRLTPLQS